MGLLATFPVLVHDLVGLLSLRGEEAKRDFKVIVAHADGATCISRSQRQPLRPQTEGRVSRPSQEKYRVENELKQAHLIFALLM